MHRSRQRRHDRIGRRGRPHLGAGAFARRVAAHLTDALRQKRGDTLRIVAAPRFLGLLRPKLDAAVKAVVVDEVDKDQIDADDDIAKRLLAK